MAIAGFEHGKGSQQPRNVGRPWKLETARKPRNIFSPRTFRRNTALLTA